MRKFLTGNQAIARGIYEANVDVVCAYHSILKEGLLNDIKQYKDSLDIEVGLSESASLTHAIEISNLGKRVVAFLDNMDEKKINIKTKIKGALVVILNDDTGIYSDGKIIDNRQLSKLSKLPLMEPGSSRDTKNMLIEAFRFSETYNIPVLFRLTARVGCSAGIVVCNEPKYKPIYPMNLTDEEKLEVCMEFSENSDLNKIENNNTKVGFICSGICTFYTKEVLADTISYLDLKIINPIPQELIIHFATMVDKIYVVEENNPYIENQLKELGIDCLGKDFFKEKEELSSSKIRECIFGENLEHIKSEKELVISEEPFIDLEYILSLYDID